MRSGFLRCGMVALALATVGMAGGAAWADGNEVAVNVKEMGTNRALSGVKVTVRGSTAKGDFFSGDDGVAKIPMPTDEQYVSLRASSEGLVPVALYWNRRGASEKRPDHFDLLMEHAAGVSGTVVDQAGQPLAGAKVMCVVEKKYSNGQQLAGNYTAVTADAQGHWAFEDVPESFDKIELDAYHRDCLKANPYYELNEFKDIAGLKNGTAVLKLTRGTPVTITVKNEEGRALRNAVVGYGEDRVASNVYPTEKTNGQGQLTLGILPNVEAVLTVQLKGYAPELVRVHVGDGALPVNITLQKGHLLEGNVLEASGDPAAGASVYIDTWRGARTLNKRIKVDADGHFSWTEAPADEVLADVVTDHGEKRGVKMKAGEENRVSLVPPTEFKGTVVDAATGQAVTGYTVALGIGWDQGQPINWQTGEGEREVHKEGGTFDVSFSYPYPFRAVRVIAEGYLPSDSQRFAMEGKEVDFAFKLEKGKPIHGTALAADGKPLAGATVVMALAGNNIQAQNGKFEEWALGSALTAQTGADGSFTLPPQRDAYALAMATDAGVALAGKEAFEKEGTLKLQPWARLEGTVHHGTKAIGGTQVTVQPQEEWTPGSEKEPRIFFFDNVKTDDAGKFSVDRLYPGKTMVSEEMIVGHMGIFLEQAQVTAEPGKTAQAALGGVGRPVKGRVEIPADLAAGGYQFGFNQMTAVQKPSRVANLEAYALPVKEREAWWKQWRESAEGKASMEEEQKSNVKRWSRSVYVKPDGTFEVQDVPEGEYTLLINMTAPDANNTWNGKALGSFGAQVKVPAVAGGVSDEALDVGTLTMTKPFSAAVGEEEPELSVKTATGADWKLSAQRGKVVLLYLFTTKADEAHGHLAEIQAVNEAYGKDAGFAMIGLDIGSDPAALTKYAADHRVGWAVSQPGVEEVEKLLMFAANEGMPCGWIVGADGKVAARDVMPEKMREAVEKAMSK